MLLNPFSEKKPKDVSAGYPSFRWRVYYYHFFFEPFKQYAPYLTAYQCEKWKNQGVSDVEFAFIGYSLDNPETGYTKEVLTSQDCV